MDATKWDIYVNEEKYFVVTFLVKLCIILHSRLDDMQDHSVLRRGVPAAHKIYGVTSTINASTYAHFVALNRMHILKH
jgi:geranylgeranyl diphosphate synthase type 3